jgi:hypothetical protein
MTIRTKIIKEIINKMDVIPEKKLIAILSYIKEIENMNDQKETILSFAGKWDNLDNELFLDLTKNLHENRKKDTRTIN